MSADQLHRLAALVAETTDGSDEGAILAAIYAIFIVGTNREVEAFVKATKELTVKYRLLERLQAQIQAAENDELELTE